MSVAPAADILQTIRHEYEEMPELRLTIAQASRLWDLEPYMAKALLEALVASRFLWHTPDGLYGPLRAADRRRGGRDR